MRDPQRIAEEIQAFLMASDQSLNDRLPELAAEYKEACEEINRRLVRCSQLLRQGLRSEALHLAEAEPGLLTALQTLDFPDRAAWLDVVGIYQLASPPDLEHGVAEHLSAAYAEHDPNRNLLRKHRRLALARAPLRERLAVVRALAKLDSTNPIWDDDRRAYETARIKQLQTEARDASRRNDSAAIAEIEGDLLNDDWAIQPPNSLVQWVRKAAETIRQEEARRALPAIEARLNDAFSALDIGRARVERSRWIETAEAACLSDQHPFRERVEPALIWVDTVDEKQARRLAYDQAVARLDQALDDPDTPADGLERHYGAMTRAEADLLDPPARDALTQRYRTRVSNLDLATTRRRRLLVGLGLAAAVAVAGTSWMAYRAIERGSARQSAAVALDAAIASGRIEDVDALLERLTTARPDVLESVEILGRMPMVESLRAAESGRRRDLSDRLREAEEATPTGREPPEIAAARKLARTDDETRAVEASARRIDRRDRDLATETDRKLLPLLDAVSGELDAIEVDAAIEARQGPELTARLAAVAKRLASAPDSGPLSEPGRLRAQGLRGRLTSVIAEVDRVGLQIRTVDNLTVAVRRLPDDPEGYIAAASHRAVAFQGDVRAAELKKVLGESERPVWEPALAWSRQLKTWAAETRPLDPASARRRADFCRGYLKQFPRSPDASAVAGYADYLEALALRTGGEDGLRDRLVKALSNPSIDNLTMVLYRKDGNDSTRTQRFYTSSRLPAEGTISGVEFRISSDGSTKRWTLFDTQVIGRRDLSPQTKWARKVKAAIRSVEEFPNWDADLIGWAGEAAADADMDPICKLVVLRAILDIAAQGSLATREALMPVLASLQKAEDLAKLQWLDPEAPIHSDREAARLVIAGLPDWTTVAKSALDIDVRLRRAAFDRPQPVGWLSHARPGWLVQYSEPSAAGRIKAGGWELVVALAREKAGAWVPLGKTDGAAALDLDVTAAEGRLVFIRPKGAGIITEDRGTGR